jgi:hypothetical protein
MEMVTATILLALCGVAIFYTEKFERSAKRHHAAASEQFDRAGQLILDHVEKTAQMRDALLAVRDAYDAGEVLAPKRVISKVQDTLRPHKCQHAKEAS